jgi:predicted amidohydrolase
VQEESRVANAQTFDRGKNDEAVCRPGGVGGGSGACEERRQAGYWTSAIPLLVLMGAEDVWTPMAPNLPRRKLPSYRTRAGVVPIVGTDAVARADALVRVPAFLARFLGN